MNPFPSPLDILPIVHENVKVMNDAQTLVNEVATNAYADTGADLIQAFDLVGQVVKRVQTSMARTLTAAEKKVNDVVSVVNSLPVFTPIPINPPITAPPIRPPVIPIAPIIPVEPIPPIDRPIPSPPGCGPGGGDPIGPPIEIKPPIDIPPGIICPPCKPCDTPPICDPCPTPEPCPPPPADECCPAPDYVIKLCGPEIVYAKVNECSPAQKCSTGSSGGATDPFPIKPQGGPQCNSGPCISLTGNESVQITSSAPFPINSGGQEPQTSECGVAQIRKDWSSEMPASELIGKGGMSGLAALFRSLSGGGTVQDVDEYSLFSLAAAGRNQGG